MDRVYEEWYKDYFYINISHDEKYEIDLTTRSIDSYF
jgi:hypothetical protein